MARDVWRELACAIIAPPTFLQAEGSPPVFVSFIKSSMPVTPACSSKSRKFNYEGLHAPASRDFRVLNPPPFPPLSSTVFRSMVSDAA